LISIQLQTYGTSIDIIGAFGAGIVSAEALGVGVTALPTPFRDADWGGWMVWQPWAFRFQSDTDVGKEFGSVEFEIDSKAMRKVEPNSAMVFVAESQVGAIKFAEEVRVLQMLH